MAITAEYTEVETGKGADALDRRPQLTAALEAARKAKCPVVVAKLDRLSRDVAFISGLMAQRVPFIVAELGAVRTAIAQQNAQASGQGQARDDRRPAVAAALNTRGIRSARGGRWHVSAVGGNNSTR